jgi:hypothetical protein
LFISEQKTDAQPYNSSYDPIITNTVKKALYARLVEIVCKAAANELFRFSKALDLLCWRYLKGVGYVLRHFP